MKNGNKKKKGVSILLLIPVFLVFIGLLLFKLYSITGETITPYCGGGSTLVAFNVSGVLEDGSQEDMLNDVQVRMQRANANCMYRGKTNKNGYIEFANIIPGKYKLTIIQKDIGKGKTLCDAHKEDIEIDVDSKYKIKLMNCNQHAFNI